MRILFIGEIVGSAGIYCVKALLPELKRELGIDLTIAAAEGATGGFGIGKGHAVYLQKLGVDVITAGDFAYFKRDAVSYFGQARYLLRPANYPYGNPGRGWLVVRPRPGQPHSGKAAQRTGRPPAAAAEPPATASREPVRAGQPAPARDRESASRALEPEVAPAESAAAVGPAGPRPARPPPPTGGRRPPPAEADGERRKAGRRRPAPKPPDAGAGAPPAPGVGVISLLGQAGFSRVHLRSPFEMANGLIERVKQQTPVVLVDFHATTTSEKVAMSLYLDGKVTALIGTHVRTLSADARLLPGGTAAITHSGRTGSLNSVGGLDPEVETRKFLTQVHEQSRDAWGLLELQGVVLEVGADGAAKSISTLRRQTTAPEAARKASEAARQRGPGRPRRPGGRRRGGGEPGRGGPRRAPLRSVAAARGGTRRRTESGEFECSRGCAAGCNAHTGCGGSSAAVRGNCWTPGRCGTEDGAVGGGEPHRPGQGRPAPAPAPTPVRRVRPRSAAPRRRQRSGAAGRDAGRAARRVQLRLWWRPRTRAAC